MQWHAITSTFIHCVSPPKCSHAETAHRLNPFHEAECQTAVARNYFCFATKLFIHEECLSSGLFDTREAEWAWQWKIQKQFHDFISRGLPPPHNISATNHKQHHLFIYVTIFSYMSSSRHQKLRCPTSSGIFRNFVHKPLICVIVWPHPAVLAASDFAATNGIVLTVRQAVQTKLNQDNFL